MKHKLKNLTAKAQREIAKSVKTANTMIFFASLVFFLRGLVGLRPCGKKLGGVRGGLSSPRRCHWAEITRTFGALRDFFHSCFLAFVPSCAFALSCLLLLAVSPLWGDGRGAAISNIKLSYSCPCKVTVIYDLDAAKPTDVQFFYSSDTVAYGWLLATTFPQKTAGTNTDYWDCAAGATYGQFFFKLEVVNDIPECVMINGVCWATRNVDMPGTFADNPEDAGMFYQWNRKVGWSSTNPMVNSEGGTTWDSSTPPGTTWEPANDPSPPGYRVPTQAEIQTLLNTTYVTNVWTTENGVPGRRFTDKDNGNSIFLPAAGYRSSGSGTLDFGGIGSYWSSTQSNANFAYGLGFSNINTSIGSNGKTYGFSVRPVAE